MMRFKQGEKIVALIEAKQLENNDKMISGKNVDYEIIDNSLVKIRYYENNTGYETYLHILKWVLS